MPLCSLELLIYFTFHLSLLQGEDEGVTSASDFTIPHHNSTSAAGEQKGKSSSPSPNFKRLKLLKHSLKERKHSPMPSSSQEPSDHRTNFSTYDFKCSKFCFKKCQCDIRLSQDFEPVVKSADKNFSGSSLKPCKEPPLADSDEVHSFDENSKCVDPSSRVPSHVEMDLFDEAVALSGTDSPSVSHLSRQKPDIGNEKEDLADHESDSSEGGSLYGDLNLDNEFSMASCSVIHKSVKSRKRNLEFSASPGLNQHRGLEGLAIVSTGVMSLGSLLVEILPHWSKLKKFAIIHTGKPN